MNGGGYKVEIYSLFSGSKGNVTLIETENRNILIDAGTSMKKINNALLMSNGTSLDDITLVLLTHSLTYRPHKCFKTNLQ